ncbi:hypothetical protein PILCRDRAFT_439507 [Piloderma croceum F 1598]|uniref:Uncharacterized protein n=1 Tax=Piloderma croceum (strain F 1598) TaxID=765440 RepID=A0A0C3FYJ1_PILCF|nr:hypothetical protein PILCRDRAFT_439507 [Piloderma croceum F 1598]
MRGMVWYDGLAGSSEPSESATGKYEMSQVLTEREVGTCKLDCQFRSLQSWPITGSHVSARPYARPSRPIICLLI